MGERTNQRRKSCGRKSLLPLLCLALSLVSALQNIGPAQAADTDAFNEQIIQRDDHILGVHAFQFDGIAGNELILFLSGDSGRRIEIARQTIATDYDLNALTTIPLPADVFAFELVDFDGDQRDEILLVGLQQLYLLDYDSGGFSPGLQTILTYDRLYAIPPPNSVTIQKVAFDLTGDGINELVLPTWEGARVYGKGKKGWELKASLSFSGGSDNDLAGNMLTVHGGPGMVFTLPEVSIHDVNTDRISDLLISVNGDLLIWFQTGELQFTKEPSQSLILRPGFRRNLRFAAAALADINNDQLIDFCRVITQGDRDKFKTILEVFLGNIASGFSQRPSRRIVTEDFAVGLSLTDLNGNGAHSIVVATVPVSATSMVKAFVVQRMSVELRVYESASGLVAEEPTSVKKISCGIDLFGTKMPTRYVGCMCGDLNGDKLAELAIVNDDDELQVFRGEQEPHFSDKATTVREANGVYSIDAHDLNADGRDDLIMLGYDENGREVIHLLWSNQ